MRTWTGGGGGSGGSGGFVFDPLFEIKFKVHEGYNMYIIYLS